MTEVSNKTFAFKIKGMDCGHCVSSVEKAVGSLAGVSAVKASLAENSATVTYDPAKASKDAIFEAVEDAGFDVPR